MLNYLSFHVSNYLYSTFFNLGPSRHLRSLKRDMIASSRRAYAQNSWSNLRTQVRAYFLFTSYFSLTPVPASVETMCLYVQFLSRSFRSPQSIRNYISGVKFLHILSGHEYGFTYSGILGLVIRGVEKGLCHVPSRAVPITPDILRAVSLCIDFDDPTDVTCFCAALFLFLLMARAGNVFHATDHGIRTGLLRANATVSEDALLITFTRTKTIRLGTRMLHIPLLAIPDSRLCPVAIYKRMISLLPASLSRPLFLVVRDGSKVPMSKFFFLSRFRDLLKRARVHDPDSFSCHSFRRGGATWAFHCGIPGEIIQIYGDWSSDCYKAYIDISLQSKHSFAYTLMNSLYGF